MNETRSPGLRLHPRTMPASRAGAEFHDWLWRFQDAKQLTDVEMLQILQESQSRIMIHLLRAERHPGEPDRKADEE